MGAIFTDMTTMPINVSKATIVKRNGANKLLASFYHRKHQRAHIQHLDMGSLHWLRFYFGLWQSAT